MSLAPKAERKEASAGVDESGKDEVVGEKKMDRDHPAEDGEEG